MSVGAQEKALRMDQNVYRCGFATIENFDSFEDQVYDYAQLLLGLFFKLKFDVICDWRFFFTQMFFPHSIFCTLTFQGSSY